jgi:hypothetical protein
MTTLFEFLQLEPQASERASKKRLTWQNRSRLRDGGAGLSALPQTV